MRSVRTAVALVALCASSGGALDAQQDAPTYSDATARALHEAAMDARYQVDESVLKYTAVVRQRLAVMLRTPLKDRTLYRRESAHRLFWDRDGDEIVQVLALRSQTPVGIDVDEELDDGGLFDSGFDPMNDRLLFGLAPSDEDLGDPDEDDFWLEHPLYEEYTESYRFISGDTLTLSLPDGRRVQAIELQVVPKIADVHKMTGSLWIEPETGALVRAVYRLADTFDALRDLPELEEDIGDDMRYIPGIFKPWTAEISMIAVDYALWDFETWLPRSMRMEGVAAAGIVKTPVSFDFSYEMESVTTAQSLMEPLDETIPTVHFRTRSEAMAYLNELAYGQLGDDGLSRGWSRSNGGSTQLYYPTDIEVLLESPELPPPIWEDAPGFTSEEELTEMFSGLADLPTAPVQAIPAGFGWGFYRSDLLRYNRVEALSVGARGEIEPQTFLGPVTMTGTARLGLGDLVPNVRGDITRERLRRKVTLSGYYELATVDEAGRHLEFGNSLMAMFFGRDDGDYYRRAGGALEWTPPSERRETFRVRAYSEYHTAVGGATDFALFRSLGGFNFRPNLLADEGWEHGGFVELKPWWGSDPFLTQGGLELMVQGGTGDFEYARASLVGRLIVPMPFDIRMGLEAGGGTSRGSPSAQRLWYVGGSRTLRGYDPTVLGGTSYLRGRLELARSYNYAVVSLFSDVGWAGEWATRDFDNQGLISLGTGLSVLDGLIRIDGSYGLRDPGGFRLDLYLDGIL